jgi:glyoxylase-like metal-dependent hydrolase (beta-lactamase superfamily II)
VLDFEMISSHVWRLELPYQVLGMFSKPTAVFLVQKDNDWILIDTGPPETADTLVAALARATAGQGPRMIMLTHGHYDHAGGLEAVRRAWNPPILCHSHEVPFLVGELQYRHLKSKNVVYWLTRSFIRSSPYPVPIGRDLERGESAGGMAVIHLPGHTPGQIGFFHPEDRALICGDAVNNMNGVLTPPSLFATYDPALARQSMARMMDLDFAYLLPAHGPAISRGGQEALRKLIQDESMDEISTSL